MVQCFWCCTRFHDCPDFYIGSCFVCTACLNSIHFSTKCGGICVPSSDSPGCCKRLSSRDDMLRLFLEFLSAEISRRGRLIVDCEEIKD